MDRRARVLVVEDDTTLASLMAEALTEDGYEVEVSSDGADAIAAIRRQRPDLIILDLMMPVLSGWDFLSLYREVPGPHAPVLVIPAASASPLLGVEASPDVAAVVRKPYSVDRVLALVAHHIGHIRLREDR